MKNIVCSYTLSMSDEVFDALCEELNVSSEAEVAAFYRGMISAQIAQLDPGVMELTDFSLGIQNQAEVEDLLS